MDEPARRFTSLNWAVGSNKSPYLPFIQNECADIREKNKKTFTYLDNFHSKNSRSCKMSQILFKRRLSFNRIGNRTQTSGNDGEQDFPVKVLLCNVVVWCTNGDRRVQGERTIIDVCEIRLLYTVFQKDYAKIIM